MVRDMLRPMVKEWLTTTSRTMVERLVRDEIQRIARGRKAGFCASRVDFDRDDAL
jgi:cell pole-organizing protein PopZ